MLDVKLSRLVGVDHNQHFRARIIQKRLFHCYHMARPTRNILQADHHRIVPGDRCFDRLEARQTLLLAIIM